MKSNTDSWIPFSTNEQTRLSKRYVFDSEESRMDFIQLTGLYMSSPKTSVLLESLPGSFDVAAHIKTSNDPFMIEFAEIVRREFDEIYDRVAEATLPVSA